jgi:hypothetical protein
MTNLSYLYKLKIIGYTIFATFVIGYLAKLFFDGFSVVDTLLLILYIGMGILFNSSIFSLTTCMDKSINVLNNAVHGNLETRITEISDVGKAGMIGHQINNLIDQMETFMREMSTSINYAGNNEFFRKFNTTGLNPAFTLAGNRINESIEVMNLNYATQMRIQLNADLSTINRNN